MNTTPPTPPLRIAFIGQAGSGKTTHARLLQTKYKGDVLSFAAPLKHLTRSLFGDAMDDEHYARTANQEMGAAARRVDSNVWVRKLLEKIPQTRNAYVDDLRYPNEYIALRSLGFRFVRLSCSPAVLAQRRPTMTADQYMHESEREAIAFPADMLLDTTTTPIEENADRIIAFVTTPTSVEEPPDEFVPFLAFGGDLLR